MTPLEKLGTDILNPDKKWEDALKEWVEEPDEDASDIIFETGGG